MLSSVCGDAQLQLLQSHVYHLSGEGLGTHCSHVDMAGQEHLSFLQKPVTTKQVV